MRPITYQTQDLVKIFKKQKIATMEELKDALGTRVDLTVLRKLKELSYLTSYSHGGGFYTLQSIPRFDRLGLWSHRGAWFSRYGTLVRTAEALVDDAEAGFYVDELDNLLHVECKGVLLQLVRQGRLARNRISRRYLYCSVQRAANKRQLALRRAWEEEREWTGGPARGAAQLDELKAAIVLFFSLLDEKQRRLFAGLEALKWGHGGDRRMGELFGLDPATVARGRRQLLERDVEIERVRRGGGGRKSAEKKRQK